jgi:hypothetical protein
MMSKNKFIFLILKKRISNILLLSIMFSSLIVIVMVGIGLKGIFYDYLRSDYGNIPDAKIKFSNISETNIQKIISDIKKSFKADTLYGYEDYFKVSIIDSEELQLTSSLPLLVKGIKFDESLNVKIDNKPLRLKVANIEYSDNLTIKLQLNGLKVKDKDSLVFLNNNQALEYNFCKDIELDHEYIILKSHPCTDKVDNLLAKMINKQPKKLELSLNSKKQTLELIEVDDYYKSIILQAPKNFIKLDSFALEYEGIKLNIDNIARYEIDGDELIIDFKKDNTSEKKYKRFLANILQDFINYKRMVLKVNIHSFADDDKDDKVDEELAYLNELTDYIDVIFKSKKNIAISSEFLASDLNTFGVLDNFNMNLDNGNSFVSSIRSMVFYNPEKIYDQNILIYNYKVLQQYFNVSNKLNFIDIYTTSLDEGDIKTLKNIVSKYTKDFKVISQIEIIPSIKPKKFMFDTTVGIFGVFILGILFIAMYIVLIQFYSNFLDELSLFKLFGSKIPYQTLINTTSFLISGMINYIILLKQEASINEIMLKYFFVRYEIDIIDFIISLSILGVFVVIIYILEQKQIKKLNLIKGQ